MRKEEENAIKEYYLIDNSVFIHLQMLLTWSKRYYYMMLL